MSDLLEEIRSWPWVWGYVMFFVIVFLRASATYALGRLAAAGVVRRREPGPRVESALEKVRTWGPPAVTLSFLTIGAQTVINAAAGLSAMSYPRYLLGLVPGAAIWAAVWTSIGMAAFTAAARSGFDDGTALALAVVVVVVLVGMVALIARSRRRALEVH